MGTGSHADDKISGQTGRRGWKLVAAVGICAALITMPAAPGASANPLVEVVADTQGAVEEVASTEVPPVSSPAGTPQLPAKAPPVSAPPRPEVSPSLPKLPAAPTPSMPSPPRHALHESESNSGSYSGNEVASPEAAATAVGPTNGKASGPPPGSGRGVSVSPPTVGPRRALPHWLSRVWPAVSLGRIGRALIGGTINALGLGSPTATHLIVGFLPTITGFQPELGPSDFASRADTQASKDIEPSGGPSVGPLHSNPEAVAFVILAGLTALALLAVGSELPVFRRHYRRW
jgi:hypothetical protein